MQTFELEDKDCAIILRENNSVDILVPNYEDENEEVGDNVTLAIGIVTLLSKPEFQELISEALTDTVDTIEGEE